MSKEGSKDESERVIIRDNRKIDPKTGEARKVAAEASAATGEPATEAPVDENATLLAERTADLQRVQAEYANYRKRADRERLEAEHLGVARALQALLPILDDFERATAHADVPEQVAQILDKQQRALESLGLEKFGTEGDAFDPSIHEAVLHSESDEVSEPTATMIMRAGYKHRERLLRAAMVGVTDPAAPAPAASAPAASAPAASTAEASTEASTPDATEDDNGTEPTTD